MVTIPKAVYVTLGGGLGDVFYLYTKGENGWGYIKSLKEKYPQVRVNVMCATHNPQTVEFIKYNPYINDVKEYGWVLDGNEIWNKYNNGAVKLNSNKELLSTLKFATPCMYLNKQDQITVNTVVTKGKFILIHPFAGEPHRIAMPASEYIPLIDCLIDEMGFNVAIVGASYLRTNRILVESKPEELNYERDGVFNLIDKANCRVVAALAKQQHHFIGCWSAYSCMSWLHKKSTTVVVRPEDKKKLKAKQQKGKRWYRTKCQIVAIKSDNFDNIREQIVNTIL